MPRRRVGEITPTDNGDWSRACAPNNGGDADGDRAGKEIVGYNCTCSDDTAVADGNAAEHGDAGAEPNIGPNARGAEEIGLRANDRGERW